MPLFLVDLAETLAPQNSQLSNVKFRTSPLLVWRAVEVGDNRDDAQGVGSHHELSPKVT